MIPTHKALKALHRGYKHKDRFRLRKASIAFGRAADADDPQVAAEANFWLACMLEDLSDIDGARAAFNAALDSDVPGYGPNAGVLLGKLLMDHGDLPGARSALERAVAYRVHPLRPRPADPRQPVKRDAVNWPFHAAVGLEALLERQGDPEGAQTARALTFELSEKDDDVLTELNRGHHFKFFGYTEGARRAYGRVVAADHPRWTPVAEGMLEHISMGRG